MTFNARVTDKERNRIMRLLARHAPTKIAAIVGRPAKTVENIIARERVQLLNALPCAVADRKCSRQQRRVRVGGEAYCVYHGALAQLRASGRARPAVLGECP